jgi:hypothetical protein
MFSYSFNQSFPTSNQDPGPSQGKLPTNPFLVNGPVVNRTLLEQQFPPGTKLRNTQTINLDNPHRTVPYTDMFSIGGQRQITPNLTVNLDLVHASSKGILMNFDLNPGLRSGTNISGPGSAIVRTNTAVYGTNSAALERVNAGHTTYNAAEFQLDHHLGTNYQYRVSYTYSRSRGNTSGNGVQTSPFQILGDINLDENEGPTDFDKPHNLVVSGSWRVPHTHGMILGMVARYLSGDPFTILDNQIDQNRNGVIFDPLPAGQHGADEELRSKAIGPARNPYNVYNRGGRNGARGPDFFQADMRFGWSIPAHSSTVEVFGEVFNLTNRVQFSAPNTTAGSTTFGVVTGQANNPRLVQLALRLKF